MQMPSKRFLTQGLLTTLRLTGSLQMIRPLTSGFVSNGTAG